MRQHEEEVVRRELYAANLQEKLVQMEAELESLKKDNSSLRHSLILGDRKSRSGPRRAVELFGEIMELRERADAAFNAQDHLPRVVVVGDQSAGKTSVLEVIARARIFPRGIGEMMTRAPVQVTMSDDPNHTAHFTGSERVYRLDNETELEQLRKEVERRMELSVTPGESVSGHTISLNVRGPGLRPMVLVDLPGLIQHHTLGMHDGTKDQIRNMCQKHIENPNSIILCVQDASRDAETSSVADIVRSVDPKGRRTMFVLTKVDLAETMDKSSKQLEKILKGQKYNMKAKNYFAVVTGTKRASDSINDIRKAERTFFDRSQLFLSGVLKASTMGTDNLSRAVSKASNIASPSDTASFVGIFP